MGSPTTLKVNGAPILNKSMGPPPFEKSTALHKSSSGPNLGLKGPGALNFWGALKPMADMCVQRKFLHM